MADAFVQMRFDEQALQRIERQVAGIPGAMNRIVPPSLNRTASWAKTRMKREIAIQMGSKVREADSVLPVQRARQAKWNAQVLILNAKMPVVQFATDQGAEGVSYRLPRRGGIVPHAFYATMPSGHRGVFRRKTRRRLPIKEQFLWLHKVLDLSFLSTVTQAAGVQLCKEIASRVKWQLEKARGTG